jgi:hypothetical protein
VRRDSKFFKSGHRGRSHGVDLHQFHLIASDRRTWEHFSNPNQRVPSREWEWDQYRLEAGFVRHGSEKFLVRVDARAGTFERDGAPLDPLQRPCDRLCQVFYIGRLQSGEAARPNIG